MMIAGACIAGACTAAPAAGTTVSAATTSSAVWGPAQDLPVAGDTFAAAVPSVLSCSGIGDCATAGIVYYADGYTDGIVADETRGTWHSAELVPNLYQLAAGFTPDFTSMSCGSPGNCVTGGEYRLFAPDSGLYRAFVVIERDGRWRPAENVPGLDALDVGEGSEVTSVTCTAADYCVAGGEYALASPSIDDGKSAEQAFVAVESNGVWHKPEPVPGIVIHVSRNFTAAQVSAISCQSAADCTAVGTYTGEGVTASISWGFVATERNGTWGKARMVRDIPGIDLLSCPKAGDCAAACAESCAGQRGYVLEERDGIWGTPRPVPGTGLTIDTLACGSPGDCAAGGGYQPASRARREQAFLLLERNGTWGSPRGVPGTSTASPAGAEVASVSCPASGDCDAGGFYEDSRDSELGFVITEAHGTWGKPQHVIVGGVGEISCFAADSCAALAGAALAGTSGIMDKEVVQATRTVLSLSAARVTYGGEDAERATVTVRAALGTPAGVVVVSAGPAAVCVIGLLSGAGSCALPRTKLGAGPRLLTAHYLGDTLFEPSDSAARALTVVKAHTKTALALSEPTVAYRQEDAERISVTVTGQYATVPRGRVSVAAGKVIACVILLDRGAGECRLTASRFKTGRYRLVARYQGAADYAASASAARALIVTGAPAPGSGWAVPKAIRLPGRDLGTINALSCPRVGDCVAAGAYTDRAGKLHAFLAAEKDGTWGAAQPVPGLAALLTATDVNSSISSVSCPSPGNCVAGGGTSSVSANAGEPFVVDEVAGTWGPAREIPGLAALNVGGGRSITSSGVTEVSCPAAGACTVIGVYNDAAGDSQVFVATQADGSWGVARQLPGYAALGVTQVDSDLIACPTVGDCVVVGSYENAASNGASFTATEKAGVWTAVAKRPDMDFNSLSCPSAGNCAGVGGEVVMTETNGRWSGPRSLPGITRLDPSGSADTSAEISEVSCPAAGDCATVGTYQNGPGNFSNAFLDTETDGVWRHAEEVPGFAALNRLLLGAGAAVSCTAPGSCTVGGYFTSVYYEQGFLAQESHGTWADARPVLGLATLGSGDSGVTAIACGPPGGCAAAGFYAAGTDPNSPGPTTTGFPFVVNQDNPSRTRELAH